jgi:hypothetical protein
MASLPIFSRPCGTRYRHGRSLTRIQDPHRPTPDETPLSRALPPHDVCELYSLGMLSCRSNQRTHRSLWAALGFLCCALIVCATVVQVGHIHADGQSVRSDCALCHTAHVVVQPPIVQSLPHRAWIVEATAAPPQPIRAKHFSVFSLFTRPPPVDLAFA